VRYVDSRSRDQDDTLYAWLAELLPRATHFAVQTGYFRFDALQWLSEDIVRMLEGGGRIDIVVGANEDRLSAADLEATLDLIRPFIPGQASFTLVGSRNGLFHPKVYFVETDANRHAAIGSGNLTVPGTTHNVEAHVALDDTDDPAVVDDVRDAILAWRDGATTSGLSRPVTDRLVQELVAERAIDPVSREDMSGGERRRSDRARFPGLPPIDGMPTRPRRRRPDARKRRLRGASQELPPGKVGVVKRLSETDVKGFAGKGGTLHLSLGGRNAPLAPCLPMRPYGRHGEPRVDVAVEARLDRALRDVVTSAADPTNITHVGMGRTHRSNPDLRLNLLRRIVVALTAIAAGHGIGTPAPGDVAAVELLESGRLARVTFVTVDPLRSELLSQIPPRRAWGWLDAGRLPSW
jgi:hypothetical protein